MKSISEYRAFVAIVRSEFKDGMAHSDAYQFLYDAVDFIEELLDAQTDINQVHALLRAWRATVSIERDSRGENPVIATMVHNNQGRELNAAGVALAEYVDSLEVTE